MLLQVHDELVFDVHNSELEKNSTHDQTRNGKRFQNGSAVRCGNWIG